MANQLKIKRGTKASLPTLAAGELGFCTDTYETYVGTGSANKVVGGPNPTFESLTVDTNTIYVDKVNHRVGVGTNAPISILQIGNGAGAPELTITGGNTDYLNGAIVFLANEGTNARATGLYMHDAGGDNEWFIGRPYASSDRFVINRSATATHDKASSGYNTGNWQRRHWDDESDIC